MLTVKVISLICAILNHHEVPIKHSVSVILLDNFSFTEGLRWHKNRLWFCDVWDKTIYCFKKTGEKTHQITLDDEPVGLGWLSDGRLLITSLYHRKLLCYENNQLSLFHDLEMATPGYCHDVIYISRSGFYPSQHANIVSSEIYMITTDNQFHIAARDIGYPNGIETTPDGKTLFVSETFADSILQFDIKENGRLTHRHPLIQFDDLGFTVTFTKEGIPDNFNRYYPDGLCYDAKRDLIWIASPSHHSILCVNRKGDIIKTIETHSRPFDCVIGGVAQNTFFIASSEMKKNARTGKIESCIIGT